MRPISLHFDENPCRFSTILLLRFVKFFEETLSMVVLQAIEKVNKTLDVEQKVRFSLILGWIQIAKYAILART